MIEKIIIITAIIKMFDVKLLSNLLIKEVETTSKPMSKLAAMANFVFNLSK